MTNFEKIQRMSMDNFIDWYINYNSCDSCDARGVICANTFCKENIQKYLETEFKKMTLEDAIEKLSKVYGNGYFVRFSYYDEIHFIFSKKLSGLGELHLFRNKSGGLYSGIYIGDYEDFSCQADDISDIEKMIKSWESEEHQEVIKNILERG